MINFKTLLQWHRARPYMAVGVHAVITLTLLGFALYSQYFEGFAPCVLCIWQRWPYAIITTLSLFALMQKPKIGTMLLMLFSLIYGVNAAIAFFHVGVQAEWWQGTGGCGFNDVGTGIDALYQQILKAPLTSCKDISWRFLGLSMPLWNMIICIALCVFSLFQAWVQRVWWTDNSPPSKK